MTDEGLDLDENFDLYLDETGDVGSGSGIEEVVKDVSTFVATILDNHAVGIVMDENDRAELESKIRSVVSDYDKVTAVPRVYVESDPSSSYPNVELVIDTVYGSDELSLTDL